MASGALKWGAIGILSRTLHRMSVRRFTRLTNAFSKKLENLRAAVARHFAYYNFVRPPSTLGATPGAMAAGITYRPWPITNLVTG